MYLNVTASLFTAVNTWKKLKCLMTEEWIKNKRYMHTMEFYPAIKRMEHSHSQQHDLEIIVMSEVRHRKAISYYITHKWNLIF